MVPSQCLHSHKHVMLTCSVPVVLTLVIWLKLYLIPTMELRSFFNYSKYLMGSVFVTLYNHFEYCCYSLNMECFQQAHIL